MEKGLSSKEAKEKLLNFGKNEINLHESVSPLHLFLSQFPTLINIVLAGASIFAFLTKDFLDSFFIFLVLILNGFFGFIQEYRAEKSLEKLRNFIKPFSRVIRDGKEIQILTIELVPEDLVILSEGNSIPADGKLVSSNEIEVDESILTGESTTVSKKRNDPLFSGTLITSGKGYLIVEKTGLNTNFGKIAKTLSSIDSDKSPLQTQLNKLGKILSLIAVLIAVSLVPIGSFQGKELIPLILIAISIAIAAIPEGLPAIITIALAIGTNRMARRNAIVRKMQSVETLGAVQVILTDKTGTLTQNSMRVKKYWTKKNEDLSLLLRGCIFGNTASLVEKVEQDKSGHQTGGWDVIGDRTDGALLLFAKDQLKDLEQVKQEGNIIQEYAFDPQTKTITTVIEIKGKRYSFVRGAPEQVLYKSKLNSNERQKIKNTFEEYAKESLRVIAFAYKSIPKEKNSREKLNNDLNFLGIVGIYDPPRKEAKHAIANAKNAGIKVIMVTGDNELTALSIAKETGLVEENEDVITGEELNKITDEELEKLILKTRIFARTRPEDKLRLVSTLKKLGYIVGVTGDGVNDALALKKADVGIAMGQKGTDVAKEASDIVLVDDNFSNIVNAIEEGRTIYNNIIKSVTYLVSGNISEICVVVFAVMLGLPSPFVPTQILWINLVTDGLPALALASDLKSPDVLHRSPRDANAPLLSRRRTILIILLGISLASIILLVFRLLLDSHGEMFARTVTFNLLVFAHLPLIFIVRKNSFLKMNRFLAITIVLTIIMQLSAISFPFFREIFHLVQ